jgi:hypothetical protein
MLSDDSSDEEQFVERLADEREYEERCAESGHPIEEPYWRDSYFRQDEADSPGPLELYDIPDDRAYNNTIGSLHDFAALTHLSLGVKLLLGPPDSTMSLRLVDVLPKSLRSLTIRGYTKGVVERYDTAIRELLACQAEVLPGLGEVRGVEELIPSANVEASNSAKAREEVQYWAHNEENEGWLAV